VARTAREVRDGGLPAAQIAIACRGELVALETFGDANDDTLFASFSTNKAVVSSAAWILLQEGRLRLDEPVADVIPGFEAHGKGGVLVEHLLTHTAGFPNARFAALEWDDPERRIARFAGWRLEWEPGTRFQYHPGSSMWVLAEVIGRRGGADFRDFLRERVFGPLAIERYHLGLPPELDDRVAPLVHVGEAASPESIEALGIRVPVEMSGSGLEVERFNRPEYRRVGEPGGGAFACADALALLYQAWLHNGGTRGESPVWKAETLEAARQVHSGELLDPMTGKLANRGLGLVISGDDSRVFRGFPPRCSPRAFGHPGAGGQMAWADPATGISFVFLTNGIDRNELHSGARGLALSARAAACVAEA